jgi:hypothetical protein
VPDGLAAGVTAGVAAEVDDSSARDAQASLFIARGAGKRYHLRLVGA